ncbi:MAG: hypothetical protein CMN76_10875 [Spirochaetaceae bacterium]|nr:hypothetical protein [Spirochaetaceae bacterium]
MNRILPVLLMTLLAMCMEPQVIQNYPDYEPQHRIAIVRKPGFTVAVSESQRWGDTLKLTPGKYLIEFREKFTSIKGAAICQLEPGGIYDIEIVRKRYMKMSGRYVYEGECRRSNEPLPPEQYELPEDDDDSDQSGSRDTDDDSRKDNDDSSDENRDPIPNDTDSGLDSTQDSEVRPLSPEEEDVTSDDPMLNPAPSELREDKDSKDGDPE